MKKIVSFLLMVAVLVFQFQIMTPFSTTAMAETRDIIYLDEDFSSDDYELNKAYSATEISAINPALSINGGGYIGNEGTPFVVRQAEWGRYLEIGTPDTFGNALLAPNIAEPVNTGELVIEMKFKNNGDSTAMEFGGYENDIHGFATEGNSLITGYCYANGGASKLYGGSEINPSSDSFGFRYTRTVWSRNTADEVWTVKLYDLNDNTKLLSEKSVDLATLTNNPDVDPTDLYFARRYNAPNTANMYLAALKIYKLQPVTISAEGLYDSSNRTITVSASQALLNTSVTADTVKITDAGDNVISSSAKYANGKIVVTTSSVLQEGTYNVVVDGVETITGRVLSGLSCTFEAEAYYGDIIYLDEDFSSDDYELNTAYSATEISAINPALGALGAGNNGDTTEKIYTVKSENGVKYLSMSSIATGRITLAANIADSVTDGELVIEMKFREVGHNGAVDFGGYKNDVHGLCCETSETATGWWYAAGGDSELYDRSAPSRPEGGFYHTRTVWTRSSVNEPWTVKLYDLNNGNNLLSTKSVDLGTLTGDANVDPTDLYFATKYCVSEDNVSIDLTALKVYKSAPAETVVFSTPTFTSDGITIDKLTTDMTDLTAILTVKDTADNARSYMVVLAVYDAQGNLLDSVTESGRTNTDKSESTLNLTLDELTLTDGAYAKIFYWNYSYRPYRAPEVLSTAGFQQAS